MQFHSMPSLDVLGKIAWVSKILYPMIKSQISLSSVQEISLHFSRFNYHF